MIVMQALAAYLWVKFGGTRSARFYNRMEETLRASLLLHAYAHMDIRVKEVGKRQRMRQRRRKAYNKEVRKVRRREKLRKQWEEWTQNNRLIFST